MHSNSQGQNGNTLMYILSPVLAFTARAAAEEVTTRLPVLIEAYSKQICNLPHIAIKSHLCFPEEVRRSYGRDKHYHLRGTSTHTGNILRNAASSLHCKCLSRDLYEVGLSAWPHIRTGNRKKPRPMNDTTEYCIAL